MTPADRRRAFLTWNAEVRAAAAEYAEHPIAACKRTGCHDLAPTGQPTCHRHRDTRKDTT